MLSRNEKSQMFGLFYVGSVVSVTANWVIACLSGELMSRAANDPSVFTMAFFWLKALSYLRHCLDIIYANTLRIYANQNACPFLPLCWHPNFMSTYHV